MACVEMIATEPYYLLHLILFSSYLAARASASTSTTATIRREEIQAILAFSLLAAVKMVKDETWEAFIGDILFYAKGFLFVIALFINHNLAVCYAVAFLVISIISHQPPYTGLGDSIQLTPLYLESLLTEGNATKFWLVEFRSLCSSKCVRTSRIFPDLSTVYSNKKISFGIVDLGHFPNAAERFRISLGDIGQLPTYILFDNAVEVARFPRITDTYKASQQSITKSTLCQYFELDRRLICYISGN